MKNLTLPTIGGLALLYIWVAWGTFQYRNPHSNDMSLFRDFGSVVTFQKLSKYQP